MRDDAERHRRNAASKAWADHDGEPWSGDEDTFLTTQWEGGEDELATIAELLGRTIEACRQRFYLARRGINHVVIRQETTTTVVVTGWIIDHCDTCGRLRDVYQNAQMVRRCEECIDG